jgi:hypothetical protein
MVAFYNQGDKAIYDSGQYFIPQEAYRLNYTPPIVEEQENPFGLTNSNSFKNFVNSDDRYFSGSGNAFGYGSAIRPADPSVITSGPYAGQSGYYGSANYTGGLPGNVQQSGPGRYFDYGQVNEDGESVFYKDYSIQPKKQFPSWMRAGAAFIPFGNVALNFIENRMNPTKGLTASEIDKNYMGSYGIAGLSDKQKMMYDNLAGKGMLFEGPGGLKTLTGKNFSADNYLENQLNIYNENFANMTDEEIEELKNNPKKQFKYKQYLESSAMYKTNKAAEEKRKKEFDKPGGTGEQVANLQQEIDTGKYSGGSDFAQKNQAAVGGGEKGRAANTDNNRSTGTSQGYTQHYIKGGLVSL